MRTWAEINLSAISHNITLFRKHIPKEANIMAVVKANGYGHGAAEVAKTALQSGASWLAVATLEEAKELRKTFPSVPLLILGYTPPEGMGEVAEFSLSACAFDRDVLKQASEEGEKRGKIIPVHLKVDTGMGRIGVTNKRELLSLLQDIKQSPYLQLEGLFTHFACADEEDKSYSYQQYERFRQFIEWTKEEGITPKIIHCSNSAAAMAFPEWSHDGIRLGISMYGLYPSPVMKGLNFHLKQAMTLKSRVVHIKEVEKGTPISYGATYQSKGIEKIATIPVGYGDGYSRLFSNRGKVLIDGIEAPIVGRVCMDQMMVNVTHIPHVKVGDEVVLFGYQKDKLLSLDTLAEMIGTINYEIPCVITGRVPRIYTHSY
ncbi:alanine racemase [Microaerobacter geothermalis]|nr:alanine racemase [Microaerobacter geothermalis]